MYLYNYTDNLLVQIPYDTLPRTVLPIITALTIFCLQLSYFTVRCMRFVTMDPNNISHFVFRMIDRGNREYNTSVESIGSAGETIPPQHFV